MSGYPLGSAIPGALVQLMAVAKDALPDGALIFFGEDLPDYVPQLTLHISEVTGDQQPAEIGPRFRREETFAFVCSLIYFQGGVPDFPALLTTLMDSFALVAQAVGANANLNGAVRFAEVGNFHIVPGTDPTSGNSGVTIDFSVRCSQRVESISTA